MGSDNVLEATVVPINGTVDTANACNRPDLFYAIRGGGGGTYDTVTSVVIKAYPSPKTTTWSLLAVLLDPEMETDWWHLMAEFSRELEGFKDGGVQGCCYFLCPPVVPSLALGASFSLYDKPEATVFALSENFRKRRGGLNSTVEYPSYEDVYDSFLEYYSGNVDIEDDPVGTNIVLGSWLLPAETFRDVEAVAGVLQEVGPALGPNKVIRSPEKVAQVIEGLLGWTSGDRTDDHRQPHRQLGKPRR